MCILCHLKYQEPLCVVNPTYSAFQRKECWLAAPSSGGNIQLSSFSPFQMMTATKHEQRVNTATVKGVIPD